MKRKEDEDEVERAFEHQLYMQMRHYCNQVAFDDSRNFKERKQ